MYNALVLACWMGSMQPCMQVQDTRGPYKTVDECETRIVEMIHDARIIWKMFGHPFKVVDTVCTDHAGSKV